MFHKLTVVIVMLALPFIISGCRKKSSPPPPPSTSASTATATATETKTEVMSQAQYDAQAKKDINTANMKTELDKIEQEVVRESGSRPR